MIFANSHVIQPQTLQPTGEKWGVEYFFFEMFGVEEFLISLWLNNILLKQELFNSWLFYNEL